MEETADQQACFRLASACCRWPGDERRDAAVIAAARDMRDWPLFLRVIRGHRIEALAQVALSSVNISPPDDVAVLLRQRAQAIARRNMTMAAEAARLQGLLDAAGVPSLVLKGGALAQLAYGSLALKFSQDIDLAVTPARVDIAIDALARDGYRVTRPGAQLDARQRTLVAAYGREVAMRHPQRPIQVELRWQLVNSPSLIGGIDAHSPYQEVAPGGALTVRTLRDDDLFAYLCVHGGGHGWSRLQWLADLNAFIAARDDEVLRQFYRHAQKMGAGLCATIALALCEQLLGRELPADIARDIRVSLRTRLAVALSLELMAGPDVMSENRRFATTRVALMQWLLGSGVRHYISTARDLGFRLDDMLAWPLPRSLHFLYPLARLPLWLWRRLAPDSRSRFNVRRSSAAPDREGDRSRR